jgi:hypothetical protein
MAVFSPFLQPENLCVPFLGRLEGFFARARARGQTLTFRRLSGESVRDVENHHSVFSRYDGLSSPST